MGSHFSPGWKAVKQTDRLGSAHSGRFHRIADSRDLSTSRLALTTISYCVAAEEEERSNRDKGRD